MTFRKGDVLSQRLVVAGARHIVRRQAHRLPHPRYRPGGPRQVRGRSATGGLGQNGEMAEVIGKVAVVRVGPVQTHRWDGREVRSGAVKAPVTGRVHLGPEGLDGDGQADLRVHGGPEKAMLLYNGAHYPQWRQEQGLDLPDGALFENLTLTGPADGLPGPDESTVVLGETWRIGTTLVQISQPRSPCWKLAKRWGIKDLVLRVQATGWCGWYVRVLETGDLGAGDEVLRVDRPGDTPTLADVFRVVNVDTRDLAGAVRLVDAPGLPDRWRTKLRARLAGERQDDSARIHGPG